MYVTIISNTFIKNFKFKRNCIAMFPLQRITTFTSFIFIVHSIKNLVTCSLGCLINLFFVQVEDSV